MPWTDILTFLRRACKPSVGISRLTRYPSATAISEATVLPSLSQWIKNHLTAIIQATTHSALDAFPFKDAVIAVNGRTISRYELRIHDPVTQREICRNEGIYFLRRSRWSPCHWSYKPWTCGYFPPWWPAAFLKWWWITTRPALLKPSSLPPLMKLFAFMTFLFKGSWLHPSMLCCFCMASATKGAPAIECRTYSRLVSPGLGPEKKKWRASQIAFGMTVECCTDS